MAVVRALVSVSDKRGVTDFVRFLQKRNVDIISTGGTAKLLKQEGVPVRSIDSYTGHPEIMDGRIKTLHPKVHGGILAVRDNPGHIQQMAANSILPIDLVVVNLYPFKQTVARPDVTIEEAIENIDIGGPAMLRSSAKNHKFVAVIVDPDDYQMVMDEMSKNGDVSLITRRRLALKAFRHTADYDMAISSYLSRVFGD
jgi:phosphoribosylaminoimidazolecarboxamide formyltransferase/IMP cyclohydrolase